VPSHTLDSSSEDEALRMARPDPGVQANANDFKVEIPEFEASLILKSSWIEDTRLRNFFSTKTSLKTRR